MGKSDLNFLKKSGLVLQLIFFFFFFTAGKPIRCDHILKNDYHILQFLSKLYFLQNSDLFSGVPTLKFFPSNIAF